MTPLPHLGKLYHVYVHNNDMWWREAVILKWELSLKKGKTVPRLPNQVVCAVSFLNAIFT